MYGNLFKTSLAAILSLYLAIGVSAQDTTKAPAPPQPVQTLTIDEAVDLGMKHSSQIRISQAKMGATDQKYKQYLAQLAPNIAINSSVTHSSENLPFYQNFDFAGAFITFPATAYNYYLNALNISQVVFAGLRGWNTLAMSKEQIKAAQYDLAADKRTARNNIIIAYYNHYKLLESKRVVAENIEVQQLRLRDIQNLQTVGMALKNDVLKIQIAISNLQQSADEVQSAIDVSNYNLDVMTGLPENTKIQIVDAGLISTKGDFDINSGLANALRIRPEVKAADVRLDISHKALRIARGMYSPVISGGFNYYYNEPNQREFIGPVEFKYSWDIGVRLSWNITGLFTNQFQTNEAKINIQEAEAQHDQLSDNIKMEVNSNYADYKLALDKISLNQNNVDQATENRRMTKDQYDNGIKNVTDMLDADNLVTVSQINLLNARIDAEIAYAKLLKATGN
jgi:outer membrane protein